jgi:antitoxin (DNA-binding transcriptional repressor) of toxin-antitoxin stability system
MAQIKTVGIKDLKNNLSAWLRDVRRGTRLLVADRNVIVAELHEPEIRYTTVPASSSVMEEWVKEGRMLPPTAPKGSLPRSPVKLKEGIARQLLDQDRGEES